jgi:hypothetical protein
MAAPYCVSRAILHAVKPLTMMSLQIALKLTFEFYLNPELGSKSGATRELAGRPNDSVVKVGHRFYEILSTTGTCVRC